MPSRLFCFWEGRLVAPLGKKDDYLPFFWGGCHHVENFSCYVWRTWAYSRRQDQLEQVLIGSKGVRR